MDLVEITRQLCEWWGEIAHYTNGSVNTSFDYSYDKNISGKEVVRFHLYTTNNVYHFGADPEYLGCISTNRRADVGEGWRRGRDLPDGKFSKETWDRIWRAIAAHELVGVTGRITETGQRMD